MEGSVLSFLKVEWKMSDTGSAHWASSYELSWPLFVSSVKSGENLFNLLNTIKQDFDLYFTAKVRDWSKDNHVFSVLEHII
jgi:hypothetical protein